MKKKNLTEIILPSIDILAILIFEIGLIAIGETGYFETLKQNHYWKSLFLALLGLYLSIGMGIYVFCYSDGIRQEKKMTPKDILLITIFWVKLI